MVPARTGEVAIRQEQRHVGKAITHMLNPVGGATPSLLSSWLGAARTKEIKTRRELMLNSNIIQKENVSASEGSSFAFIASISCYLVFPKTADRLQTKTQKNYALSIVPRSRHVLINPSCPA